MSLNREKPVPSYRRHKQSGQAIVTLTDGLGQRKDVLLGPWKSKESREEYARVIAEWEVNGRCLSVSAVAELTVAELIDRFWPWATKHYRLPDGTPTKEVSDYKMSFRPLNFLYGNTVAKDFGPLALKAVRELMVKGYAHPKYGAQQGLCRRVVNQRTGRIRRLFRWAVENELVPPSVYQGLAAVRGLQRGRADARETEPVKPVARSVVEETLRHLRSTVADMCRLQLETGMRPGELVIIRACDIDMSGAVWLYRPGRHKTEHHGHARTVPIGPKGQAIVRRHLKTDLQAYLFSPADSIAEFRAEQRECRKSKVPPSQRCRRKRRREKQPGDRYTVASYCRAIYAACDAAFPSPQHLRPRVLEDGRQETRTAFKARLTEQERTELKAWRNAHQWHPHQLRHTRATELRREYGLDVARTVLGHRSPIVTEIYAEADRMKAAEAMLKLGRSRNRRGGEGENPPPHRSRQSGTSKIVPT
jgi:integrase